MKKSGPESREKFMRRAVRVLVLLQRRRGVTLAELEEELDATERTAFHFLAAVEEAGLPIERMGDDGEQCRKQAGGIVRFRAFGRWEMPAIPKPQELPAEQESADHQEAAP